ncbi:MAG: hypothetical protein NTY74_13610 [Ignavibacteriae bacterium]|nr:hypothetical protein [Ignavibacteriota bacterium]
MKKTLNYHVLYKSIISLLFILIAVLIFILEQKKIVDETTIGKKIYADSLKSLIDSLIEREHFPFVGYTEPMTDASTTTICFRGKVYTLTESFFDRFEYKIQMLNYETFTLGGPDISLRSLQSLDGWRVSIREDYIKQKDVRISGPVKTKQVSMGVYEIQLALCSSKVEFEKMFKNKKSPYTVSFNIVFTDTITGEVDNQQRAFTFGSW